MAIDLRRYRVNFRFLLRLGVLVLVVGVGLFFLHRHQSQKLVTAYRTLADRAKADGDLTKEQGYLRRYLTLAPNDAAARVRYGYLQYRFARKPDERIQAYLSLQDALRTDPSLPNEVRLQSAKIALHPTVRLAVEARRDLDALLQAEPANAAYEELFADSHILTREYTEADGWLSRVVNHDPGRVDAFAKQAYIRRTFLSRPADADASIEAMLAANPKSVDARLNAADYWRMAANPGRAAAEVRAARGIDPDHLEVLVAAAELILADGRTAAQKGRPADAKAAVDEAVGLLAGGLDKAVPKLPAREPPPEPGSPDERTLAAAGRAFRGLVQTLARAERAADAERWARRQIEVFPDAASARLDLVDTLILKGQFPEAEQQLAALDRGGYPGPVVDHHRGRIAVAQGRWADAGNLLRRAVDGLGDASDLMRQTHLLLATVYRQTGEPDRRYESFRRAVPTDPTDPGWVPAVAGVAEALADLGRFPEAITEYRRLVPLAPAAKLPLARLLLADAVRQPADKRDLSAAEQAVNDLPAGPSADLLKAEVAAARGQTEAALTGLDEAIGRTPDEFGLWAARVLLLAPRDRQKADEAVALAARRFGETSEVRLLKLRLLLAGGAKPAAGQLAALAAGTDAMSPADRDRLLGPLVGVALRFDHRELARGWADRLVQDRPADLGALFQRFDLALLENDQPTLTRLTEAAAGVAGGPDTTAARVARAFALMARAKAGDKGGLAEANELLVGLERDRAGWPRLHVATAQVSELAGDRATAARRYRRAVDLGERDPAVIDRLLDLYRLTGQFAEAEALFRQVPDARPGSNAPAEVQAELFLGTKDFAAAAAAAERAVPADATDPAKLYWKARILLGCGRTADSEKALRRLTEVAPDRPEGWVGLAQLLAATGRASEVRGVVDQARGKLKPADAGLAAAQCFESAGDMSPAAAEYDRLLATRGGELPVVRAAAGFKLRTGDLPAAHRLFEKLLDAQGRTPEDEKYARRMIALCLAGDRDPATVQRALAALGLADVNAAADLTGAEPPDELRTRAVVLAAQRGRRAKLSAVKLMEAVEARVPLTGEDHLLIARLYQLLGDWPKAKARFQLAVAAPDAPPAAAVSLAAALLQNGDPAAAAPVVRRATEQGPKSAPALELQARLAAAENRPTDVVRFVEQAAAAAGRPGLVPGLLEQLGQHAAAEQALRGLAADKPAAGLALAAFLGRRGRAGDALAAYDRVRTAVPPEMLVPTLTQTAVDLTGLTTPEQTAQLVGWVAEGAAKVPALTVYLAAVQSLAQNYAEAERVSRQVLAADPNNLVALNNLAFLLGVKDGKHEEGLKLIRQALAVAGPVPTLLDTEAVLLTAAGDPEAAVDRLTEATADEPTAVVYAHLAMAYLKAGKRLDALAAYSEARKRNLREFDFHPLEWAAVRELKQKLGTP